MSIPDAALGRLQALRDEHVDSERMLKQMGTNIPKFFAGLDTFITNPSNVGTGILARMIDSDETVSASVQFMILMILSKIGEYHHEDKAIKDFVQSSLSKLKQPTWQVTMETMLSSKAYGFSVSEIVWGLNKKLEKIPVRIPTYHPSTIAFEVDQYGLITEEGVLQFVNQYSQFSNPNSIFPHIGYGFYVKNAFQTPTDRMLPMRIPFMQNYGVARIPRNKVVHHVNLPMFSFGNPYGKTPVRTAHLAWQLKVFFMKQLGIAGKRQSTPTLHAQAPLNNNMIQYKDPKTGEMVNRSPIEAMRDLLSMRETDDALITGPEGQGYKISVLNDEASLSGFTETINFLNVLIFRAFLLPSLVLSDASSGNRALGDKHFQIVDRVAESDALKFSETIVNDLIEKMIIDNFGPQENYGKFNQRPQNIEERERLSRIFNELANNGFLEPHVQEDFDFVRESLSVPKREVSKFIGGDLDPEDPTDDLLNDDPSDVPGGGKS